MLDTQRVECDGIWSFCQAKAKNVSEEHKDEFGWGDVWTWTAIDADTKLVPCWHVGDRSADSAAMLMSDLAFRMTQQIQLATDGHAAYLGAVKAAFGGDIYYAMLIRLYADYDTGTPRAPLLPGCLHRSREAPHHR